MHCARWKVKSKCSLLIIHLVLGFHIYNNNIYCLNNLSFIFSSLPLLLHLPFTPFLTSLVHPTFLAFIQHFSLQPPAHSPKSSTINQPTTVVLSSPAPFYIPILPIPFPFLHFIPCQHQLPSSHQITPQCFNWLRRRGKYQKREGEREKKKDFHSVFLAPISCNDDRL